jgi:hypothetical protein
MSILSQIGVSVISRYMPSISKGILTYISPASNRFFKLSFIASGVTLLIKVRSETPISFFFVVSNAAFLIFGFPPDAAPLPPSCAFAVLSFLRVIAY